MPTDAKVQIIEKTVSRFKNSSGIYFTKFSGMSVNQSTDLRRAFRENNVDYIVTKNTLTKLAAKDAGYEDMFDNILSGQIAIAYSMDDPTSPARVINNFKKINKNCLEVVGVFFEGNLLDVEKYKELANLPTREELIVKFINAIGQPMNKFASILNSSMTKLVCSFECIKNNKN